MRHLGDVHSATDAPRHHPYLAGALGPRDLRSERDRGATGDGASAPVLQAEAAQTRGGIPQNTAEQLLRGSHQALCLIVRIGEPPVSVHDDEPTAPNARGSINPLLILAGLRSVPHGTDDAGGLSALTRDGFAAGPR